MSEDLAHDAHLRAALRHAPDHALVPPSGLSQTILAAARQAHRPIRPTPAPPPPMRMPGVGTRPLRAWLRRLFAPRWAGAWAAGLVASLGLGLWLDFELRPAVERPVVVAVNSAPPEATRAAQTPPAPTPTGEAATDKASAVLAKAAPTESTSAAKMTREQGVPQEPAGTAAVSGRVAAQRAEAAPGSAQRRAAEDASHDAALRADAVAPPPAAAPAVAAAPPVTEQPTDELARAAPPPGAAGQRAALPDARKEQRGETVTAASPAFTLLRRAQAELAAGSAAWAWGPPGSGAMVPFDAAAQAWLSRVVQLARGRWVDVAERGEALDALEVRWWRDGWPHATLRIETDGLRWIEPSGRIRYAPLDAAALRQLRSF